VIEHEAAYIEAFGAPGNLCGSEYVTGPTTTACPYPITSSWKVNALAHVVM
jgi:hypothetical protein